MSQTNVIYICNVVLLYRIICMPQVSTGVFWGGIIFWEMRQIHSRLHAMSYCSVCCRDGLTQTSANIWLPKWTWNNNNTSKTIYIIYIYVCIKPLEMQLRHKSRKQQKSHTRPSTTKSQHSQPTVTPDGPSYCGTQPTSRIFGRCNKGLWRNLPATAFRLRIHCGCDPLSHLTFS